MNIAVINETSAGDKNSAIIKALENRGHKIINAGMKQSGGKEELTYIHTGLIAGMMLNSGLADFVIGGCGTGQGFLNSAMQYPGVFCGLIIDSLDAWLFTQINGGNAISLALNKGFGWAGEVNLSFIFDRLFSVESGCGYPENRKESQAESRSALSSLSTISHKNMNEILLQIPEQIISDVLNFPGIKDIIRPEKIKNVEIKETIEILFKRYAK